MIILDTDFASVLAKADIVELVIQLFSGKHDFYITPEVYEELSVPERYGYISLSAGTSSNIIFSAFFPHHIQNIP